MNDDLASAEEGLEKGTSSFHKVSSAYASQSDPQQRLMDQDVMKNRLELISCA